MNYIPYTHWVYLKEIALYFDKVFLLSPVKKLGKNEFSNFKSLSTFSKIEVIELPYSEGYTSAVKFFYQYILAYRKLKDIDVAYARYPVPFGWMQLLFLKRCKRIIHFVGDPYNAIHNNPNFSFIKKSFLKIFFTPEHLLYVIAGKRARVFTNGHHLSQKLSKYGIRAIPLVSSTLVDEDFINEVKDDLNTENPIITYAGYLRRAKGIHTVIGAFRILKIEYPKAELQIIGDGDFRKDLENVISESELTNVKFFGHIDDRNVFNELLRKSDIFSFGSLSEGSPRIILEAMANGVNVLSTPVGSLPKVFNDKIDIVYTPFNDESIMASKMSWLLANNSISYMIRKNAHEKVRNFTIHKFIKNIFHDET
ncbi:glycosyltransferase family 4 protein [Lutimonas saemankumensis]|uniref:glycosyltransferase family 4 protein n=1 Tax=Lutimonas saemankumensis TaxID=483016 RepID=UPI001CD41171|nr:glycosyltransferase family 4 protein [Lutimonas saemankumensis]MCA0931598.1 glycosyltransferase family 4 protein [Lutimonas saemankumensis]